MSELWKKTTKLDKAFLFILLFFVILINIFTADKDRWPLDDAWILNHAVKSVSAGQETSFVDSNQWIGITSQVFFLLIYIFSKATSVINAHFFIQTAAGALYIFGLYVLCRKNNLSDKVSAAATLLLSITGMSYFQLMNGLETGLAMAAVVWCFIALESEVTPIWGYLLIGLLPFIRPELSAFSGLAFLDILIYKKWGDRNRLIRGGLFMAAVFAGFVLFLLLSSGSVLSQTASAKNYFYAEGCFPLKIKAHAAFLRLTSFFSEISIVSLGFIFCLFSKKRILLLGFIAAFISAYILQFPDALRFNHHRYTYIILPCAVYGIIYFLQKLSFSDVRGKQWISIAVLLTMAYFNASALTDSILIHQKDCRIFTDNNRQVLEWIAKNDSPDAPLLIMDAGLSSEVRNFKLIDFIGLKTLGSMRLHQKNTYGECKLTPETADKIASLGNPRWLISTASWDHDFKIPWLLVKAGWNVRPVYFNQESENYYRLYFISKK